MNTFYFNTGVTPFGHSNPPMVLSEGQVWRNGTKQIPFDAEAPAKARLMFIGNDPNLLEAEIKGVIVSKIYNTVMIGEYAYFRT